jgi:OOP family OmpA-OmpF porin
MNEIIGTASRTALALGLALTVPLVSTVALPAAQAGEAGDWYLAPTLNYIIADDDRDADDDMGFRLGVGRQLNDAWNLELNLEADTLDIDNDGGEFKQKGGSLDGLYFFDRDAAFAPYGLIGVGALNTKVPDEKNTHAMANVGVGFLSHVFSERAALRGEVRYRWDNDDDSVPSEDSFGDWVIGIGLAIALGGGSSPAAAAPVAAQVAPAPAPAPVTTVAPPLDSDGDGVADASDACPDSPAGSAVDARGCAPDADGDGVADTQDRCPGTAAGIKVDAQGCEPDSDGDGVVDSADRCADTAAGARTDVHGCEIKEVVELKGVNFATGSARLLAESTAILDDAAATLRKHPEIKAEVAGHTDNTGSRALNVKLSQQRATAVMNYLVAKGVPADNLTAHGYGPDHPLADNATADGRAANRRVELRIAQ